MYPTKKVLSDYGYKDYCVYFKTQKEKFTLWKNLGPTIIVKNLYSFILNILIPFVFPPITSIISLTYVTISNLPEI